MGLRDILPRLATPVTYFYLLNLIRYKKHHKLKRKKEQPE